MDDDADEEFEPEFSLDLTFKSSAVPSAAPYIGRRKSLIDWVIAVLFLYVLMVKGGSQGCCRRWHCACGSSQCLFHTTGNHSQSCRRAAAMATKMLNVRPLFALFWSQAT
jgi:hypothetical protein